MNPAELIEKIIAYGADKSGINDRFAGNADLYAECFREFMTESNHDLLKNALANQDYRQAFASAHALKGLSGNLGVTPYYRAVCALVESLRANKSDRIDEEYAEVVRQLDRLQQLYSDAPLPVEGAAAVTPDTPAALPTKRKKADPFFTRALTVLLLVLVGVGVLFLRIFTAYSNNIAMESAEHLIEINYQLKLYMEERITNDWKIANSLCSSFANWHFAKNDDDVIALLLRQRNVWEVTDIEVYTENGDSISANGKVKANDVVSDIIDQARRHNGYMSIIESEITYSLPVQCDITYRGAKIVTVSVVQSMETFLDDMGFSSFDDKAYMYLTEDNGIVISRLTNAGSAPVFNFMSLISGETFTVLDHSRANVDPLTITEPTAYTLSRQSGEEYVVATPILTRGASLRLFYLAPVSVVNATMHDFSRQLIALSAFVLLIFIALAVIIFMFVYQTRKRQFDQALHARERMLDLLIQNTQTAFGLFHANEAEPSYISSNSPAIIGDAFYTLVETGDGFHMRNQTDTETSALRALNESMRAWDGKSEFKSGYLLNDQASPPSYFEVRLYPVDDDKGDFVGIAQDITQAHEREEATRSALAMAERANAAKSRFLSNMSHDIRTPMNAIVNMANFAVESMHEPRELAGYLHTIQESANHLLTLINDVLDMSRIESGQVTIESKPFDIVAVLERQADIARPLSKGKHQTFLTDFSKVRTKAVLGDALKLSQIVSNLLSNAIKFTPENGAVRFSALEIPALQEGMADIRLTIEDTGMGISRAYIEKMFEPFSRADEKRVSGIEGTGLGLSIVHSYVTAMGGAVSCESEEGEGSTFTVELFFQAAGAVTGDDVIYRELPPGITPFLGKHCLLAEDNKTNQLIAKTMLERLGFMVDVAGDGLSCVQHFLQSPTGSYDIVYMDIQMPIMNGYQAAQAIRESNHPQAASIPIVAMTANVFAEDVEKARVAGMNGHLGKPILLFSLVDETQKVLKKEKGDPS